MITYTITDYIDLTASMIILAYGGYAAMKDSSSLSPGRFYVWHR